MDDSWWKILGPLGGVFVGFVLSQIKDKLVAKRRRKSNLRALRAECRICKEYAETYLNDGVMAPLYRLPTQSFTNSLPSLLGNGEISEQSYDAVARFFNDVETLNRGLDQIAQAAATGNDSIVEREYNRNCLKARNLINITYPTVENTLSSY